MTTYSRFPFSVCIHDSRWRYGLRLVLDWIAEAEVAAFTSVDVVTPTTDGGDGSPRSAGQSAQFLLSPAALGSMFTALGTAERHAEARQLYAALSAYEHRRLQMSTGNVPLPVHHDTLLLPLTLSVRNSSAVHLLASDSNFTS